MEARFVRATTTRVYDALGRVRVETAPHGAVTRYHYDAAGRCRFKLSGRMVVCRLLKGALLNPAPGGGPYGR